MASSDVDSYDITSNGTQLPARDIDLWVQRPGQARGFAMLLFGINWMLTHITIGHVLLARRLVDTTSKVKHLISAFAILLAIPQLRNSMPDSPGLDYGMAFSKPYKTITYLVMQAPSLVCFPTSELH